jgi:alpha-mannosidase
LICHSHTDAGWYKTYDQYFQQDVEMILNSVVDVLSQSPKYKFNWSDISFLAKWYKETTEENRQAIQKLVKNGQFSFMGGGWVMHDESLTDYRNVYLQLKTGHKWLNDTFGVMPRIGWQIDPFGNSAVTPGILSVLGYEGIVLNRIGTTLSDQMEKEGTSEFIWKGVSMNTSNNTNKILAHHLVNSKYQPPAEIRYEPKPFPHWMK